MAYLTLFLLFLLVAVIPFFSVFIQTIKNLIMFAIIIMVVSGALMAHFGLEFFPLFFMLIYIGAIIVSTLFMVLTFDLRREYVKKIYFEGAFFNISAYFFISAFSLPVINFFGSKLWPHGSADEFDRLLAYNLCLENPLMANSFCARHFGGGYGVNKSLYNTLLEHTNDIAPISDNLYTSYGLLFIILGVILTMALFAALTMLKGPNKR